MHITESPKPAGCRLILWIYFLFYSKKWWLIEIRSTSDSINIFHNTCCTILQIVQKRNTYKRIAFYSCLVSGHLLSTPIFPACSHLGSQRNFVFSPSSLQINHSLKEGWTNILVPSLLFTRKTDRLSIRCWKSSQSNVPCHHMQCYFTQWINI